MNEAVTTVPTEQKNIYSRIQPDLSNFTVQELENALKEIDNF